MREAPNTMTSSEIDKMDPDAGTLEWLPPAQAPSAVSRAMLREHAQMMADAYQLAKGICGDGRNGTGLMVPQRFRGKPEEAAAAMIYGSELGLNPLQAVQRVVPIHGMPTLEARTMVGLLKARGYKIRTVEQSDTSVTVEGFAPDGETASSTWTIDRAKRAGYVPTPSSPNSKCRPDVDDDWVTVTKTWDGKAKKSVIGNMKYITDPQAMLKAKAQSEVCRDLAPDVLMGISYTREDLESERQDQFEDRRSVAAPARTQRVTVDEIFAEEVPLSADGVAGDNPPTAAQVAAAQAPEPDTHQAPAGDVTEDQGDGAPDPGEPSPAEQSETVVEPEPEPEPAPEPAPEPDTAAAAAKSTSKKVSAKRSTAPAANPEKPKTRMRQALEKRLFALIGDAGIAGDKDRDGRIAVYRSILENQSINSTDDLDDPAVGKVADQLYAWQQQNELDDQIADILADAARESEETSAAPAADPTSEGNE
ncbi:ssDNA binding protein [Mycobacterium phage Terror]|uniref:SsDNA binding protein n=1 Tax=Mycobacterium phage Taheera TaxID=1897549 RepID=A0A1D8EVS9_9CAUD|nr:RecT-like ssDNA annealing protein [Mycobacterium phage Taheera]AOT25153.1 ssDNA binding protein [Mycobacterium phage Taheera]AOT25212.1 ssDNA binding protein [Mycobacterium phage Terror]